MKFLLVTALLVSVTFQISYGKSLASRNRRPQCICSRKVTAIMQDASGAYCVYYDEGEIRQWACENRQEWNEYFYNQARSSKEPRCQCTGDVTAIMQDITGTYCVYYGEDGNRQWECENREEWEFYKANANRINRYY